MEYRVAHPRWRMWKVSEAQLNADVEGLYGREFGLVPKGPPASAFLAEGSSVEVCFGRNLSV
ncbi:MAG: hypothetical protein ACRD2O_07520 [Terriglobia bacterium]